MGLSIDELSVPRTFSSLRLPRVASDARAPWLAGGIAFLVALALQPALPLDGAAGSLARAARFRYGGGAVADDWVLSDPLGTIVLGAVGSLGMGPLAANRSLVAVAFGAVVFLLAAIVRSSGGSDRAALLTAGLACAWAPLRESLLASAGLCLSTALSLAALFVAPRGRPRVTGALFGLALFESPIALCALAGPIAASLWVAHLFPGQLALAAGLVYVGSSTVRFALSESPWPVGGTAASIDAALERALLGGSAEGVVAVVLVALAVARVAATPRRDQPSEIVAFSAAAWSALALVLGTLGLWRPLAAAAALLPPLVLLGALAPAALAARTDLPLRRARELAWALLVVAFVGALLASAAGGSRRASLQRVALARDRLDAGSWLARAADATETVRAKSPLVLLGARALDAPKSADDAADYVILEGRSERAEVALPEAPRGYVPVAILDGARRRFDGLPWTTVYGRTTSRAASTGARAFTLRELEPYSEVPGAPRPKAVEWHGADLFEHPSGGIRFRVPNQGRRYSIRFRPAFASQEAREGTDGVSFELRAGGVTRFRQYLYGADPEVEYLVRVVDALPGEEATLDLLVGVGPAQNGRYDHALWRDVRIFVEGGAPVGAAEPAELPDLAAEPSRKPGDGAKPKSNEEHAVF